jgi:hypothetical protein
MNKDFPCLEFIKIARECRKVLISDTLDSNSDILYDALYSDSRKCIYKIKLELYEIEWIELYWEKIIKTIENNSFSSSEKKELFSIFAKWYKDFISNWKYTEFDATIFEERICILKELISINNKWEDNLKKMNLSFDRNKKILNKKIEKFKMEE